MPVVTIEIGKGRTLEQKRQLVQGVTDTVVSALGVTPDWVTVLIHELDQSHIAKAGKLLSDS
jgi:4-oxalocrotonate tautomerase